MDSTYPPCLHGGDSSRLPCRETVARQQVRANTGRPSGGPGGTRVRAEAPPRALPPATHLCFSRARGRASGGRRRPRRYKQQLLAAAEREQCLQRDKVQLELDWRHRCDSRERDHYRASEDLLQALTAARDQVCAPRGPRTPSCAVALVGGAGGGGEAALGSQTPPSSLTYNKNSAEGVPVLPASLLPVCFFSRE